MKSYRNQGNFIMKITGIIFIALLSISSAHAQQPDLREIRYATYDDYTRIVFEFSGKVKPLIKDLTAEQNRVELIFSAVNMTSKVKSLSINDGLVKELSAVVMFDGIKVSIEIMAARSTLRNHYFEQPDRVVLDIYKADESQLSSAEKFLQEGIEFFNRKEYDEAIAKLRQALRIRPGYSDAYFYAGIIRKERNQLDMAKFNFEKALTDEEKWSESHLHLADILLTERDTASAIRELSRYVAVGKSEAKVIQAEALLSTLTGFPSIESPAEKPSEMDDEVFTKNRIYLYSIIGILLLVIVGLSVFVYRDKSGHNSALRSDNPGDHKTDGKPIEESSSEHEEKIESAAEPIDSENNIDKETTEQPEKRSGNNERWLKTDKETIAEVDRLMDKFEELEEDGKKIDTEISDVMKEMNGKD